MAMMNELCCGPYTVHLAKAYSQAVRDQEVATLPPPPNLQLFHQVSLSPVINKLKF